MKNKKRIVSVLLAVLIVILLALLGGILYQYFHVSRELKETKMGKEYQNELKGGMGTCVNDAHGMEKAYLL